MVDGDDHCCYNLYSQKNGGRLLTTSVPLPAPLWKAASSLHFMALWAKALSVLAYKKSAIDVVD